MGGDGSGGLDEMLPIFKMVKPQSNLITNKPFIFHLHTTKLQTQNQFCLCVRVTDFEKNTFQVVKSVLELEDMRETVGIGGPWTDFVDYLKDSFTSEDLKFVLEGESKYGGAGSARVIAQKSDGMPTISIALTKLKDAAASDTMADITLELFKLYTNVHASLINEQQRCYQLSKRLTAEQEKNYVIQGKLDASLASQRLAVNVSHHDKNVANHQTELDSSPLSQASTAIVSYKPKNVAIQREVHVLPPRNWAISPSVSCQEKHTANQRELDALAPSRAISPAVSCQEKGTSIQRELYASPPFRALAPSVSRKEKNDDNQRELDASSASRPQKFKKISDLSTSALKTFLEQSGDANIQAKRRAKFTASSNTNCVIPAYRRQKVEGILLEDGED